MDKLQRLRMTIALLLDAEESLAKYQSTLDECGFACVGYKLEIGESKSAIIQRIDVARNALLKLRKEIDKEVD